jgi:hypothetical protein
MARIDAKLNLVISLIRDDDSVVHVHAAPLSRMVFEQYFVVISKTFAELYGEGLGVMAGPKIAALMLRKIAQESRSWEGPSGVQAGLVAEMRRLANVMLPSPQGWVSYPLQSAIDSRLISEDEIAEVDNLMTFFICNSAVHRRSTLLELLERLADLWGTSTTSLNATAYLGSLRTSIADASTGGTAAVS